MHLLTDVDRGSWLAERAGTWGSVGGVAGTGFEAYARILHPVEARRVDSTRTDEWGQHPVVEETTWPWATVAARTGRMMHPLVQWLRLTANDSLLHFPDGWMIEPSRQGWFDPRLFAALTAHLSVTTTTPDDIVVGIWEGWGFSSSFSFAMLTADEIGPDDEAAERSRALAEQVRKEEAAAVSPEFLRAVTDGPLLAFPGRNYVLVHGSLTELADPAWGYGAGIGWMPGRPDPTPQLFWPGDHAWVIASEIDWDSTIVAGGRQLVDDVLADPVFEAFEVREDDLLMHDSDHLNT